MKVYVAYYYEAKLTMIRTSIKSPIKKIDISLNKQKRPQSRRLRLKVLLINTIKKWLIQWSYTFKRIHVDLNVSYIMFMPMKDVFCHKKSCLVLTFVLFDHSFIDGDHCYQLGEIWFKFQLVSIFFLLPTNALRSFLRNHK